MSGSCPLCPQDGSPLERGIKLVPLTYKTETTIVGLPGWYCHRCDEGVHTPDDMEFSDRSLAALKARADNLLRPEDIRRIRLQLGLTQREAGQLVGGGVNAFQKYESGEILPSKGLSNLLRILERHPDEIATIRDDALQRSRGDTIEIFAGEEVDFPASAVITFSDGGQDWQQAVHPVEESAWLRSACLDRSTTVV